MTTLVAILTRLREPAADLIAIAGAASITQGAAILHPAAGFIVGGALTIVFAVGLMRSAR